MERQRVIIGFTTNELRLFTKLAHKDKRSAEVGIENGIERWSHQKFLKKHNGFAMRDESDFAKACEEAGKKADRKYGVSDFLNRGHGSRKMRKYHYYNKLKDEARKECEEQYLEDHPSLQARMDLYSKLDRVLDQIRYPSLQDDEWRKTRVVIQA